jgi:hypothetical protein
MVPDNHSTLEAKPQANTELDEMSKAQRASLWECSQAGASEEMPEHQWTGKVGGALDIFSDNPLYDYCTKVY